MSGRRPWAGPEYWRHLVLENSSLKRCSIKGTDQTRDPIKIFALWSWYENKKNISDKTKSNQEACFRILVVLLGLIAESRMLHKSHFVFLPQHVLLYIRFPYVDRERHGALMNKLIWVVKDIAHGLEISLLFDG